MNDETSEEVTAPKLTTCDACGEYLNPNVRGFYCEPCAATHLFCNDGESDDCLDRQYAEVELLRRVGYLRD